MDHQQLAQGSLDLWRILANDYANNVHWQPRRLTNANGTIHGNVSDPRLHDIDPSRAPTNDDKFTPENLRSIFSRLRIDYTRAVLKFQAALSSRGAPTSLIAPTPSQQAQIDQEFWERHCKQDKSLYYIFTMFKERAPQDCLLIDTALTRPDTVDLADSALPYGQTSSQPPMLSGRKRGDLPQDDDIEYLMVDNGKKSRPTYADEEAQMNGDIAAMKKDRAVAMYYRRATINADIHFYLDLLTKENIGDAIKRNAKSKMQLLLMKKLEDRYDDLSF